MLSCVPSLSLQAYSLHRTNLTLCIAPILLSASHQAYSLHRTNLTLCITPSLLSASHQSYSLHHTNLTLCITPILLSASHQSYSLHCTNLTLCIALILLSEGCWVALHLLQYELHGRVTKYPLDLRVLHGPLSPLLWVVTRDALIYTSFSFLYVCE